MTTQTEAVPKGIRAQTQTLMFNIVEGVRNHGKYTLTESDRSYYMTLNPNNVEFLLDNLYCRHNIHYELSEFSTMTFKRIKINAQKCNP